MSDELEDLPRKCRWCGEVDDPGSPFWCCNERMGAAMDASELRRLRSEVTVRREQVIRLAAVADAARVFHAKGPDFWDDGKGDPDWSALGAALSALDGSE